MEYREVHFGAGVPTGRVLTIHSANQVSIQETPAKPGMAPLRPQLSCGDIGELPSVMREGWIVLRRSYGTKSSMSRDEASLAYRWGWIVKRAVWHNPPSEPQPPFAWDSMVSILDGIEMRAKDASEEAPGQGMFESEIVFEYGHRSSGIVGSQVTLLAIDKAGFAGFVARMGGATKLAPEEFSRLLRAIEDAKFTEFEQCYGRYTPVNLQATWMWYRNGGKEKGVTWMSPPSEPKPPEGWARIAEIVDPIEERARTHPFFSSPLP